MRFPRTSLLCALLGVPIVALGQSAPAAVVTAAQALNERCQAAGGRVVNGDRPFVHQLDLTGDRRPDWIVDEAGFACSNRSITVVTRNGAPLAVVDGATGKSLWRGLAYTYALEKRAPRNILVVTLRGAACGSPTTTCRRPLTWDARSQQMLGAPTLAASSSAVASIAPGKAGSMTLTENDRAAAFRALGFKQVGRDWKRCAEETPTLSYTPGAISEVTDLNGDGRPEVVITEGSLFCYGSEGNWFAVLSKEPNGAWRQVLEIDGLFTALPSRTNGWRDISVGGPRGSVTWRYNGSRYVGR